MFFAAAVWAVSCSDDCDLDHLDKLQGLPAVTAGTYPEGDQMLEKGKSLALAPRVESQTPVYYRWMLNGDEVSTEPAYTFAAAQAGRSLLRLEISNDRGKVILENRIIVPGGDYSDGFFVINEGWYGHESGSISFYDRKDNTLGQWIYKNQNYGAEVGVTAQSATFWKGKLYVCAKEQRHLTVIDPETMYEVKTLGKICTNMAYEFVGLDDRYGIVTTKGGLVRVDLSSYEYAGISPGNTWNGCGAAAVYNGKLLVNVNGNKLYVFDVDKLTGDLTQYGWKFPYEQPLDVYTSGGSRFVAGDDGNMYVVETTKEGQNNLVKIKPDFSVEKAPMRADYSPSSFGAYREAMFCGTGNGTFYYVAGGKIYKCTFENAAPAEPFIDYAKADYSFYGAGIRVNSKTGELVAIYNTPNKDEYFHNLLVRFDAATGDVISETQYDGYRFPATVIFK